MTLIIVLKEMSLSAVTSSEVSVFCMRLSRIIAVMEGSWWDPSLPVCFTV